MRTYMSTTIRRFLLLVMLLVSMAAVAVAQELAGTIIDEKGEPVPFVSVTLLNIDSTYVIGTTTDEMGHFELTQGRRAALLRASCIGYRTTTVPIMPSPMTVTMPEDAVMLQAVEVVTMRKLVKNEADRLSYNMSADPDASTSTLLEMLRKVPMVSVDAEDNVLVRGTKSFKFYRNGHPDPSLADATTASEVLNTIPASSIERIEVITEPGAKYDAEGASVILNIVTMRGSRNSSLNGTVTSQVTSRGVFRMGLQLAGGTGKFSISGNANARATTSNSRYNTETETDYTYATDGSRRLTRGVMNSHGITLSGQLNASYEIDTLNLLAFAYSQYRSTSHPYGTSTTEYYDNTGTLYSQIEQLNGKKAGDGFKNKSIFNDITARVDYEHRTHLKDEILTASFMFNYYNNHRKNYNRLNNILNPQVPYSAFSADNQGYINEHTLQLDYQRPLWAKHRLEVGLKYIHRFNHSHTITDYVDAESMNLDDKFNHRTQVAAAYLSWLYNTGALSMRAGVRYEFTYMSARFPDNSARDFHNSLNDVVPSFMVNWQINPSNSLRMSYSTNINRPSIYYLNPTVVQTLTKRTYGNPNLSSTFYNSLSLTYSFMSNKLTFNLSPSLMFSRNWIDSYNFVDDEGFEVNTYRNGNRMVYAELSGMMQWMPAAKTSFTLNAFLAYVYQKNPSLQLRNTGWGNYISAQLSQELFWKIKGSLGASWSIGHSPVGLYGYSTSTPPVFDITLRRSFLDDRLTVSLRCNDPTHCHIKYEDVNTKGDMLGHNIRQYRRRSIMLNLSYRFGKSRTSVKRTATTIENNDQVGGASGGGE